MIASPRPIAAASPSAPPPHAPAARRHALTGLGPHAPASPVTPPPLLPRSPAPARPLEPHLRRALALALLSLLAFTAASATSTFAAFAALAPAPPSAAGANLSVILAILFLLACWVYLIGLVLVGAGLTWPLARWVAIPLGRPLAAFHLARLARAWSHDRLGGAALTGAVALLHRRDHDDARAADLAERLAAATPLGAAGIAANGLLAASRGDRDAARDLLRAAIDMESQGPPTLTSTFAADWLAADAAERGDWAAIVRLGQGPISHSRATTLLLAIARRLLSERPSPTDAGLTLAWLLAPRHQLTRPLVDRARATPRVLHRRPPAEQKPPPPPVPEASDEPRLPDDPFARALALHAHWSARDPLLLRVVPARLGDLARAWDELHRRGLVHQHIAARAAALGVPARAEATVDAFFRDAAEELADLSLRAGVGLGEVVPEPGAVTERAVALLRSRLLTELEAAAETMESRTLAKRSLPAVDEFREWSRLRQLHEHAAKLGGMELRHLVFPQIHRVACNFAVWLWNERKEYAIATPIFRWLLAEAEAVGDEAAIELQRKNVGVKG